MKFYLTVAILFIHISTIKAQKITLAPKIKVHQFTMPVRDISVITISRDTSYLGMIQKGLLNNKKMVLPDKPLNGFYQDYISSQYKSQYKPEGKSLLYIIKYLRIGERSGNVRENAFVRLSADAYVSDDQQQYQLACSIDTLMRWSGVDVTHAHNRNIEEALDLIAITADNHIENATKQTKDTILHQLHKWFSQPAFTLKAFRQGVYLTHDDFLHNNPQINGTIEKDGRRLIMLDSLKNPIPDFWGFSYQGIFYKKVYDTFVPFIRYGGNFEMVQATINLNPPMTFGTGLQLIAEEYPFGPLQPYATGIDIYTGELTL